jgi:hypothetical protein
LTGAGAVRRCGRDSLNRPLASANGGDRRLWVEVRFAETRERTSLLLGEAREYPQRLLSPTDAKREPRTITLTLSRATGTKRGKGRGSFAHDTRVQAFESYRGLVQELKGWPPKAPQAARRVGGGRAAGGSAGRTGSPPLCPRRGASLKLSAPWSGWKKWRSGVRNSCLSCSGVCGSIADTLASTRKQQPRRQELTRTALKALMY